MQFQYISTSQDGEKPGYLGQDRPLLYISENNIIDDDDMKTASEVYLKDIYDADEYKGKIIMGCEYNMGDGWAHDIASLGRTDPSMRKAMSIPDELEVICLSGEGHPGTEDCGGPGGWADLKDLFEKKGRKDPKGFKAWYKNQFVNGDKKGSDSFNWDILGINGKIDKLEGIKAWIGPLVVEKDKGVVRQFDVYEYYLVVVDYDTL